MGTLIGLCLAIGLLLMMSPPPTERNTTGGIDRYIAKLLTQAGIESLKLWHLLVVSVLTACLSALVTDAVVGITMVTLVAMFGGAVLPLSVLQARRRRRIHRHAQAWPDAVDHLASAVRAGMSLPEALIQLAVRGPEPLRGPFREFGLSYQRSGRFFECLDDLKKRCADPVADRVVESLRIARDVGGGDLGPLLRTLSGFLREDLRVRGELEARQSWTVVGARLAVAAPWLVLVMMSGRPETIMRFNSDAGMMLLAAGAVISLVWYRAMLRIGRLAEEPRVLL